MGGFGSRNTTTQEIKKKSPIKPQKNEPNEVLNKLTMRVYGQWKSQSQTESLNKSTQREYTFTNANTNTNTYIEDIVTSDHHPPAQLYSFKNTNNNIPQMSNEGRNSFSQKNLVKENSIKSTFFRSPTGKIITINSDLSEFLFSLPTKLLAEILLFLIYDLPVLRLVSSIWYIKVNLALEQLFVIVDNQFITPNSEILLFKSSETAQSIYTVQKQRGIMMERVIYADIVDDQKRRTENTIIITSSINLIQLRKERERYGFTKKNVEYIINITSFYQNFLMCDIFFQKHNFDENKQAFIQSIMPVCEGDSVKITINLMSLNGFINLHSLKFHQPKIEPTPVIPQILNPLIIQNLEIHQPRFCQLERLYQEWFTYEYYQQKDKVQLNEFQPFMTLEQTFCAGVDIITNQMKFQAMASGQVPNSIQLLGCPIDIYNEKEELCVSLKKSGVFSQTDNSLALRQGDILIFYLSKGD